MVRALGAKQKEYEIFFTRKDLSVFREIYFNLTGQKCVLFAGSLIWGAHQIEETWPIRDN